ncbi:MAG: beta-N-acetylhexosaminidase [Gemmatimonadaceae bacterium]|nr:beta-N-acetylhexosaminidase [Gemmatimonadaceae bacterium]
MTTPVLAATRFAGVAALLTLAACRPAQPPVRTIPVPDPSDTAPSMIIDRPRHSVIPAPLSLRPGTGDPFVVDSLTPVVVRLVGGTPPVGSRAEVERIASWVRAMLGGSARPAVRIAGATDPVPIRSIVLELDPTRPASADGAYELAVSADGITIAATQPAGLFYGMQTLRQLFPVAVEHPAAYRRSLRVSPVRVVDAPRYGWRGGMLDVSRHFLAVEDVKRFIDHYAFYKINRLHLHLSDDQGWRVEIASWPNLSRHGGSTEVGGGPGGFYTQDELRELVAYARERYMEIVPEFDVPGHTNAALASYPELNCDGVAPPLYTGIRVGFSALCVTSDATYRFLDDVVREIGTITGPWFHIGGDEVERLTHSQYLQFIARMQEIVRRHGKTMIGWGEIAPAALHPSTIVQHWKRDSSFVHAARGGQVILSPSPRTYLDMKYDSSTVLGLQWAARIDVRDAYDWDPATYLDNVPAAAILGIEAPLWSETLEKVQDFEFMVFPRMAAIAEIGWTPQGERSWDDFRLRLAAHGPRLAALGVNFYRSPQIPWAK